MLVRPEILLLKERLKRSRIQQKKSESQTLLELGCKEGLNCRNVESRLQSIKTRTSSAAFVYRLRTAPTDKGPNQLRNDFITDHPV